MFRNLRERFGIDDQDYQVPFFFPSPCCPDLFLCDGITDLGEKLQHRWFFVVFKGL